MIHNHGCGIKSSYRTGHVGPRLPCLVRRLADERARVGKDGGHGFSETRQSHGYLIQHLIEAERTITELASRMEVTQQAASKMVAEMARRGIVELIVSEDRRAKRVRLSTQGWESVKQARKIRGDLEKRLEKVLGAGAYQESKAALLKALDALGGVERVRTRRLRMAQ